MKVQPALHTLLQLAILFTLPAIGLFHRHAASRKHSPEGTGPVGSVSHIRELRWELSVWREEPRTASWKAALAGQ